MTLETLKRELELFGERHDAETAHHGQRMLNITRDTGAFLGVLVRATGAKRVLEVGTSNGYSTLWLAEAVRDAGGKVMTLELQESKRMLAFANVERAGLLPWIELVGGDAEATLEKLAPGSIDLLFLDADRSRYQGWWPQLQRLLARGVCWWSITRSPTLMSWPTGGKRLRPTPDSPPAWCRWERGSGW
ncbi:O-methyltransferase [Aeromonas schubertii]|uniref:O-methyltransferase n=1 Tax=Aeromonas schubertii TaxID=652 RepID=A0A0S2SGZ2_9GAMM|nr:class I SAM-dependent methyltransferase [Aeromonas schubertii]ALP40946.1 O-methyltransferase [Aeromonas schubertii]